MAEKNSEYHGLPDLSGIIQKSDVFKKGSGSYSADYVSWARIAHYLHVNANGWQFHLRPTPDGAGTVWTAPDGTGYVIGYFGFDDGFTTADFPFPCMDNRNNPIPIEKVSCRVLTDTHRRALCACAAFTFGLGFELWAKAEVADAQETQPAPPAPAAKTAAKSKPTPTPQPAAATPIADQPLSHDDRTLILACMQDLDKPALNNVLTAFREKFGLAPDAKVATAITTEKHAVFLRDQLAQH
jgi:hypothetical protein